MIEFQAMMATYQSAPNAGSIRPPAKILIAANTSHPIGAKPSSERARPANRLSMPASLPSSATR
jgi:hypothetical protein